MHQVRSFRFLHQVEGRMTLKKFRTKFTQPAGIIYNSFDLVRVPKTVTKGKVMDKSLLPTGKLSAYAKARAEPFSHLTPTLLNRVSSPQTLPGEDRPTSPPFRDSDRITRPTAPRTSTSGNQTGEASASNASGSNTRSTVPCTSASGNRRGEGSPSFVSGNNTRPTVASTSASDYQKEETLPSNVSRIKTRPTVLCTPPSANQVQEASPSNAAGSSAVAARPLWDRVAHLLAVRSYKYPQLLMRLNKDRAPDKARLQEILSQVSFTRQVYGGLKYFLLDDIYQKLDPDTWPGYNYEEREAVNRKMTELRSTIDNCKRPYLDTFSSPGESSEEMHEEKYSFPAPKRQRVSHMKGRTSERSTPSPTDLDTVKSNSPTTIPMAISPTTTQLLSSIPQQSTLQRKESAAEISFGIAQLTSYVMQQPPLKPRKESNSSGKKETVSQTACPPKVQEKRSLQPLHCEAEKLSNRTNNFKNFPGEEDFMTKYTTITSSEQRDQYERDFNAEHQEYLKYHSNVAKVSGKFAELQRRLQEHKKGSKGYMKICKKVIQKYNNTKENPEYQCEKARWEFLHRKLQHIKNLVNQYDQQKLVGNFPESRSEFPVQTKTAARGAQACQPPPDGVVFIDGKRQTMNGQPL